MANINNTYQLKWIAHTGRQHPNMSTTFMGKSKPLEDLCKQTPISAQPKKGKNKKKQGNLLEINQSVITKVKNIECYR